MDIIEQISARRMKESVAVPLRTARGGLKTAVGIPPAGKGKQMEGAPPKPEAAAEPAKPKKAKGKKKAKEPKGKKGKRR